MNKIYKVVWSKVKNCYVVVSEIAKNVISGSVKSAKVGCVPVTKGFALGALMVFAVTGNVLAAELSWNGHDYSEKGKDVKLAENITVTNWDSMFQTTVPGVYNSLYGEDCTVTLTGGSAITYAFEQTAGIMRVENVDEIVFAGDFTDGIYTTTGAYVAFNTIGDIKQEKGTFTSGNFINNKGSVVEINAENIDVNGEIYTTHYNYSPESDGVTNITAGSLNIDGNISADGNGSRVNVVANKYANITGDVFAYNGGGVSIDLTGVNSSFTGSSNIDENDEIGGVVLDLSQNATWYVTADSRVDSIVGDDFNIISADEERVKLTIECGKHNLGVNDNYNHTNINLNNVDLHLIAQYENGLEGDMIAVSDSDVMVEVGKDGINVGADDNVSLSATNITFNTGNDYTEVEKGGAVHVYGSGGNNGVASIKASESINLTSSQRFVINNRSKNEGLVEVFGKNVTLTSNNRTAVKAGGAVGDKGCNGIVNIGDENTKVITVNGKAQKDKVGNEQKASVVYAQGDGIINLSATDAITITDTRKNGGYAVSTYEGGIVNIKDAANVLVNGKVQSNSTGSINFEDCGSVTVYVVEQSSDAVAVGAWNDSNISIDAESLNVIAQNNSDTDPAGSIQAHNGSNVIVDVESANVTGVVYAGNHDEYQGNDKAKVDISAVKDVVISGTNIVPVIQADKDGVVLVGSSDSKTNVVGDVYVNNGGSVRVILGTEDSIFTGSTKVDDNDGAIVFGLYDGATWEVTENSNISKLSGNNINVVAAKDAGTVRVTIDGDNHNREDIYEDVYDKTGLPEYSSSIINLTDVDLSIVDEEGGGLEACGQGSNNVINSNSNFEGLFGEVGVEVEGAGVVSITAKDVTFATGEDTIYVYDEVVEDCNLLNNTAVENGNGNVTTKGIVVIDASGNINLTSNGGFALNNDSTCGSEIKVTGANVELISGVGAAVAVGHDIRKENYNGIVTIGDESTETVIITGATQDSQEVYDEHGNLINFNEDNKAVVFTQGTVNITATDKVEINVTTDDKKAISAHGGANVIVDGGKQTIINGEINADGRGRIKQSDNNIENQDNGRADNINVLIRGKEIIVDADLESEEGVFARGDSNGADNAVVIIGDLNTEKVTIRDVDTGVFAWNGGSKVEVNSDILAISADGHLDESGIGMGICAFNESTNSNKLASVDVNATKTKISVEDGTLVYGVYANGKSNVNISGNVDITATGYSAYGVEALNSSTVELGSVGKNVSISAISTGDGENAESIAVYAGDDSKVDIIADALEVNIENKYDGGSLQAKRGSTISVNSNNATIHGIVHASGKGSIVDLSQAKNLKLTTDEFEDYGITPAIEAAEGGKVVIGSEVGKTEIEGDIYAHNGGQADVVLATADSVLDGTTNTKLPEGVPADVGNEEGVVNLTLSNAAVWNVTGDSTISSLDGTSGHINNAKQDNSTVTVTIYNHSDNDIHDGEGIYSGVALTNNDLTIGEGMNLVVDTYETSIYNNNVKINSLGDVAIKSKHDDGICVYGDVVIGAKNVTIEANDNGIKSADADKEDNNDNGTQRLEDGNVTINANENVTIKSVENGEGYAITNVSENGGKVEINANGNVVLASYDRPAVRVGEAYGGRTFDGVVDVTGKSITIQGIARMHDEGEFEPSVAYAKGAGELKLTATDTITITDDGSLENGSAIGAFDGGIVTIKDAANVVLNSKVYATGDGSEVNFTDVGNLSITEANEHGITINNGGEVNIVANNVELTTGKASIEAINGDRVDITATNVTFKSGGAYVNSEKGGAVHIANETDAGSVVSIKASENVEIISSDRYAINNRSKQKGLVEVIGKNVTLISENRTAVKAGGHVGNEGLNGTVIIGDATTKTITIKGRAQNPHKDNQPNEHKGSVVYAQSGTVNISANDEIEITNTNTENRVGKAVAAYDGGNINIKDTTNLAIDGEVYATGKGFVNIADVGNVTITEAKEHGISVNGSGKVDVTAENVTIDSSKAAIWLDDKGDNAVTINANGSVNLTSEDRFAVNNESVDGGLIDINGKDITIISENRTAVKAGGVLGREGKFGTIDISGEIVTIKGSAQEPYKDNQPNQHNASVVYAQGKGIINLSATDKLAIVDTAKVGGYAISAYEGAAVNIKDTNNVAVDGNVYANGEGSRVNIEANKGSINGNVEAENNASVVVNLKSKGASFTGATKVANAEKGVTLNLQQGATWYVTGDSTVSSVIGDEFNITKVTGVNKEITVTLDGSHADGVKDDYDSTTSTITGVDLILYEDNGLNGNQTIISDSDVTLHSKGNGINVENGNYVSIKAAEFALNQGAGFDAIRAKNGGKVNIDADNAVLDGSVYASGVGSEVDFAGSENVAVNGDVTLSDKATMILGDATVNGTVNINDATWNVTGNSTISSLDGTGGDIIHATTNETVKVTVQNRGDVEGAAITNSELEFKGVDLIVDSNQTPIYNHNVAIKSDSDVTIRSADEGVHAYGEILIDAKNVSVEAGDNGIESDIDYDDLGKLGDGIEVGNVTVKASQDAIIKSNGEGYAISNLSTYSHVIDVTAGEDVVLEANNRAAIVAGRVDCPNGYNPAINITGNTITIAGSSKENEDTEYEDAAIYAERAGVLNLSASDSITITDVAIAGGNAVSAYDGGVVNIKNANSVAVNGGITASGGGSKVDFVGTKNIVVNGDVGVYDGGSIGMFLGSEEAVFDGDLELSGGTWNVTGDSFVNNISGTGGDINNTKQDNSVVTVTIRNLNDNDAGGNNTGAYSGIALTNRNLIVGEGVNLVVDTYETSIYNNNVKITSNSDVSIKSRHDDAICAYGDVEIAAENVIIKANDNGIKSGVEYDSDDANNNGESAKIDVGNVIIKANENVNIRSDNEGFAITNVSVKEGNVTVEGTNVILEAVERSAVRAGHKGGGETFNGTVDVTGEAITIIGFAGYGNRNDDIASYKKSVIYAQGKGVLNLSASTVTITDKANENGNLVGAYDGGTVNIKDVSKLELNGKIYAEGTDSNVNIATADEFAYKENIKFHTENGGEINLIGGNATGVLNIVVGNVNLTGATFTANDLNNAITGGGKLVLDGNGILKTAASEVFTNSSTTTTKDFNNGLIVNNEVVYKAGAISLAEDYSYEYLSDALDVMKAHKYEGENTSATKIIMTGDLVTPVENINKEGNKLTAEMASGLGGDVVLDKVTIETESNLLIGGGATIEKPVEVENVRATDSVATGFSANQLDLGENSTGAIITGGQEIVLGGSQNNIIESSHEVVTVNGETKEVTIVVGTEEKVGNAEDAKGTLKIGNSIAKESDKYQLTGKAVVNKDSELKTKGETTITKGVELKDGNVHAESGQLYADIKVTGNGKSVITGKVKGNLEVKDDNNSNNNKPENHPSTMIHLGNDKVAGKMQAKESKLNGATLFLDPAFAEGMPKGSEFALKESANLDGAYIAGKNSTISFGVDELESAHKVFAETELTFGSGTQGSKTVNGDVNAVVYIAGNVNLSNANGVSVGSIIADGGLSTAPQSVAAGTVTFADKSLLMLEANKVTNTAAITGAVNVTVDNGAKLYINNAEKDKTYKILAGSGVDEGWTVNNIITNNKLIVLEGKLTSNSAFDVIATSQSVSDVYGSDVIIGAVVDNAMSNGGVASEYFGSAADETINTMTSAQVDALNSIGAMNEVAGVTHTTYAVSNILTNAVADHMSLANGKEHDKDIWAHYVHTKENVDGLKRAGAYDAQYNGIVVGTDLYKEGKATVGAALTYVDGNINGSSVAARTENDAKYYGASVYGSICNNDTTVIADVSYLHGEHDITQRNSGKVITGEPESDAFSVGVRVEKEAKAGIGKLVPYAGLRYMHLGTGNYTNSIGLAYDADDAELFLLPVGLKYSADIKNTNGWTMRPVMEFGYVWAFGDTDANQTVSLNGASNSFGYDVTDSGSYVGRFMLEAERANISYALGYEYQKGDDVKADKWMFNVNWKF